MRKVRSVHPADCAHSYNDEVDEVDVFESDFESTDEEAVQEDVDAGDKAVYEEDKRARKVSIVRGHTL